MKAVEFSFLGESNLKAMVFFTRMAGRMRRPLRSAAFRSEDLKFAIKRYNFETDIRLSAVVPVKSPEPFPTEIENWTTSTPLGESLMFPYLT
jgi:hypothetical protein